MRYVWLVIAFLVAVIGVFVGRFLGLSRDATVTTTMALIFLTLYPFVKQFAPKLRFSVWVIADVIGAAVAWMLFWVLR
jgi:uncharacterized membrane protein